MNIYITPEAYMKMASLVSHYDTEVAWHGTVELVNESYYLITDILVFPQEVSSVTADSQDIEYEKWLHSHSDETFNRIRLHGHSHVNMTPHPSGVDLNYRDNLMKQVKDFYIFIIMNKSGQRTIEFRTPLYSTQVQLHILTSKGTLTDWLDKTKEVVHEPKQTYGFFQSWRRKK